MKTIKATGIAPLLHQYPNQVEAQPAFIEIDCDAETLSADWNAEIGNAVPADVWHGRTLRFGCDPRLSTRKVNDLLKRIAPLAERVLDGYEKVWNGNNHIGRFNEDAETAKGEIYNLINDTF